MLHLFRGKTNVVQRQTQAQAFNVGLVILPGPHHVLYCAAKPPAFIFLKNVQGNAVELACFLNGHTNALSEAPEPFAVPKTKIRCPKRKGSLL